MKQQQETATINPDYQLYICRYNVAYHDYNMSEAEIIAMLGPEPPKWKEQRNMIEQARLLAEQNRNAITDEFARQAYDEFMRGGNPLEGIPQYDEQDYFGSIQPR